MENDEILTSKEVHSMVTKYLAKMDLTPIQRTNLRKMAVWSFNQGLKARDNILATEKL